MSIHSKRGAVEKIRRRRAKAAAQAAKPSISCQKCGHVYFKWVLVCPACEDKVLREFDTSMKENV